MMMANPDPLMFVARHIKHIEQIEHIEHIELQITETEEAAFDRDSLKSMETARRPAKPPKFGQA